MKLVLRNIANECIKSFSLKKFELYQDFCDKLIAIQYPAAANLISENEQIDLCDLVQLKSILEKHNIKFSNIYSNNRETVLSGKSLKINSTFLNIEDLNIQLPLGPSHQRDDLLFKGTVRSGDRISSNGDLFIMGDVNQESIISSNNNVYAWGELFGIAFTGKNRNKNASIASLYINQM